MDNVFEVRFHQNVYVPLPVPRLLNEREKILLAFLCDVGGRDGERLCAQVPFATVTHTTEHTPSVLLSVDATIVPAGTGETPLVRDPTETYLPGYRFIPSEAVVSASGEDSDGMFFEVILFAANGFLDELYLWRGDLGPVSELPDPATLQIYQ